MKTIKVSEATGVPLDWMVAKCEDHSVVIESIAEQAERFSALLLVDGQKPPQAAVDAVIANLKPRMKIEGTHGIHLIPVPNYSTNWAQGGQIIEREKIATQFWVSENAWEALIKGGFFASYGPTPLVAAMRCYVVSKLGDEVEVPDELLGEQP